MGVDIEGQRLGDADRIGDLDGAALGKAGGDHILREIARDIGGRTIDLGRVLAAERAAAMGRRAAIGVDDDLAAGQAGVPVRTTDFEAAGRVDVIDGLVRQQLGRDHLGHHILHIGLELGFLLTLIIALGVLGRNDDGSAGDRRAAFVAERHLTLGIRLQEGRGLRMAIGRHRFQDLVAVIEGRGHQVGRVIGGIAEHDTLVARAFILVATGVDALRDMRALGMEIIFEAEAFPVEAFLLIADALHRFAHGAFDLFLRARRPLAILIDALAPDFAGQDDELGRGQRFAGDARFGVLGQEKVDDRVGNLVGDLVGMAFGHGFGSEEVIRTHGCSSLMLCLRIKKSLCAGTP